MKYSDVYKVIIERYKLEYVVINRDFVVQDFSKTIIEYLDIGVEIGDDIRESFYELVGFEDDIEKLFINKEDVFELHTVKRDDYYLNIFAKKVENLPEVVFIFEDNTKLKLKEQILTQNRNMNELLVRENNHKDIIINRYKKAAEDNIPMIFLNSDMKLIYVNSSFSELVSCNFNIDNNNDFVTILNTESDFDKKTACEFLTQGMVFNQSLNFLDKDKKIIYTNSTFVPIIENNKLQEIIVFAHDLTLQNAEKEKYEKIASSDILTGLLNRFGLDMALEEIQFQAKEKDEMFALLFMDIDGFKPINDNFGHDIGDEILKLITKRLQNSLRENDTIARYGGDEFIAVLEHIKKENDLIKIVQKIISSISATYYVDDLEIKIGISIGISFFPQNAQTKEKLIKQADKAMYKVKNSGKNNFNFYKS